MEYSINALSKLSGITKRTLRYYDEIGLLSPKRKSSNGYRIYDRKQVDLLQQILFYRELGIPLEEIKNIVTSDNYDCTKVLVCHLDSLHEKRKQLDLLITNVNKTIKSIKGEISMSDYEKFDGFKRALISENDTRYGDEIREKYGHEIIEQSNNKMMNLSAKQYTEIEKLSEEISINLKTAFESGNPASELSQKVCDMHKNWLTSFWDHYDKASHIDLANMYVNDPRFSSYYDKIAPGCASFLRDALIIYCK